MSLEGRVIALVEDDPIMGESLVQCLSLEGCHVDWWRTGHEALRGLRSSSPDLVVCDIRLPDTNGEVLYRQLAATSFVPPFLFVTAFGNVDQAVSLMRAGAGDYVTKPFETGGFIARAQSLIQRHPVGRKEDALGVSAGMREVEAALRRIADLTIPLLITGETGSGKEVCARFLHGISARSKEPFIAVNCAAIHSDRMEFELFGSKGAGGQGFHRGFAERTRGGVLFLDEVCELPVGLQAKLLQLVEAREFHRLGGEQLVQFHGRIICSTNVNLKEAVNLNRFRQDLYYRINGFRIEVPPLRQRAEDIPWLLDLFFDRFKGAGQVNLRGISTMVHEIAYEHAWPGNVRELRNRVERAVAMAAADWIMPADMFPDLESDLHPILAAFSTLAEVRESAERRQIERALKQTNGQIIEAAKLLDISRTTLWEKMRRLYIAGYNEP
ncbi:sigma-54-dependent Fis family transcriptional regulator [Nordella sp. HKS 07]|uniref:sigma-54-dependent transcriptional regulator n=1 Tax=Nordella sp. HKS 07 TaxID=2712222 RepID=UPI0013E1C626|nr:sigma-54 dependent transcriptional regulator [Nordella sp. HKS 07]QIG46653.1 sigma-54-dependent Fis family transcriptional regulator [Nordella sp. HKS 07]